MAMVVKKASRLKSNREKKDVAILFGTNTNKIEEAADYFSRERRENLAAQGIEVDTWDRVPPLDEEGKRQYWRDKEFERIENERVELKDRAPYDGKDPDNDGVYELIEPRGTSEQL